MAAVPLWDPVFMVAVLWHERWCSTTGEQWQCITVPGELGRWFGFGEAHKNHVEGKKSGKIIVRVDFFFSFLYWVFRFFENRLIAQNFNQLQGWASDSRIFGICPYSLSLQCWLCTFSSLISSLSATVKIPCRFSLKTWQNVSSCRKSVLLKSPIANSTWVSLDFRFFQISFLCAKGKR